MYKLNFLLEGLEFYKYTQMKAYDITKLIATTYCTEIKYITLLFVFVVIVLFIVGYCQTLTVIGHRQVFSLPERKHFAKSLIYRSVIRN